MKLATLRAGGRDGTLVVVNRDGSRYAPAGAVAPTLQAALDDWDARRARGCARSRGALERGQVAGAAARSRARSRAPLAARVRVGRRLGVPQPRDPRAQGARRRAAARRCETDPLVYQGGSGVLLGPRDDDRARRPGVGPRLRVRGLRRARRHAAGHDAPPTPPRTSGCVMLANDVTLRNLVPDELAKSFGFFQSKPATAFSPFAVTPDELGDAWRDGRVHLRLRTTLQRRAGRRLRRRAGDALLVLRSRSQHIAQDAALHRRHDPRQRHGLERRSRARHLVPRRAAHDRDDRARASRRRRS